MTDSVELEWGRNNRIDGTKYITEAGLLIGRDPSADVTIDEPRVSWRHAKLRLIAGACMLTDLDSRNGTFLDGSRIPANNPVLVNHTSTLRIGDTVFRFKGTQNPPAKTTIIPASSFSGRQSILLGRGSE